MMTYDILDYSDLYKVQQVLNQLFIRDLYRVKQKIEHVIDPYTRSNNKLTMLPGDQIINHLLETNTR